MSEPNQERKALENLLKEADARLGGLHSLHDCPCDYCKAVSEAKSVLSAAPVPGTDGPKEIIRKWHDKFDLSDDYGLTKFGAFCAGVHEGFEAGQLAGPLAMTPDEAIKSAMKAIREKLGPKAALEVIAGDDVSGGYCWTIYPICTSNQGAKSADSFSAAFASADAGKEKE